MSANQLSWVDNLPKLPRPIRLAFVTVFHLAFFTVAYTGAFLIRFDFRIPPSFQEPMWKGLVALLVVKMVVFAALRMFQGWWKYVSLHDVVALAQALAVASVAFLFINAFVLAPSSFPRSIYLLDFLLALLIIGGARGSLRIMREAALTRATGARRQKAILIVGAGDTGETLLREISKNRHLACRVVGFLDDDTYKHGLRLHGVQVLGPVAMLAELVEKHAIEQVIIAMPTASREALRRVVELAREARVETRIVPAVETIFEGRLSINQLREVSINDLLGREPVRLDTQAIGRFLQGRTVLVTGAGGSIGSELCRQVLRFEPRELVLVDNGETPLFFIHRELSREHGERIVPHVASVADADRMRAIFQAHRPDVVIHAAAYKHVPLMEQNPCEAVKNNVVGTQTVADLALEFGTASFVLISTDKAVNPTSIMGATKRVTELYIHSLNRKNERTRFCAVRFGNVLGSNGSVIPIFRDQIRNGGPVTVTHPEMTRYFMTIPEAVQLVLQAASFRTEGDLFILDMGEPVKIAELARDMIRLSGMSEQEVPIVYTGIRPGEKLFEELNLDEEHVDRTSHKKIFVGRNGHGEFDAIAGKYHALVKAAHNGQELEVRRLLKALIPTYAHPEIPENVVSIGTGQFRSISR